MSVGIAAPRRLNGLRAVASRIYATFVKELIQLRRDRITFATMIFIPLVQLMLFGYAINTDPKHLPTAVLIQDDSAFARSFLAAHARDATISIVAHGRAERGRARPPPALGRGAVRRADPGEFRPRPHPRRAAGAARRRRRHRSRSRPAAPSPRSQGLSQSVFARDLVGPAATLAPKPAPFELRVHRRYNPDRSRRGSTSCPA